MSSISALHAGRAANIKTRAQWLHLLSEEILDLDAFFDALSTEQSKSLKPITLRQLMVKGLGYTRTKAEKILNRMDILMDSETDRRRMTVGWLLDPNSGGKRFQVWLEVHASKTHAPWPGFPFTRDQRDK